LEEGREGKKKKDLQIMLRKINETAAEFRKAVQKIYCLPPFLEVPCTRGTTVLYSIAWDCLPLPQIR
jgi:hypothetical protein